MNAGLRRWLLLAALALPAQQAFSLDVYPLRDDDGTERLIVRDCSGKNHKGRPCEDSEKSFFKGDGAKVDEALKARGYSEVVLFSGGGDLDEGVKVGEAFRRHGVAVRVPRGRACVSACTVAFLGGVIRTVDEGATYEVHAYSSVLQGLEEEMRKKIVSYPEVTLEGLANNEAKSARFWAMRLFNYTQAMIGGTPNVAETQAALLVGFGVEKPRYVTRGLLQKDVDRVRLEGAAAAHSAVMNIERTSMEECIDLLRARLPSLGRRAEPALNILNAMFSSSIIRTAPLTPETLLRMGYITPILR